MAPTVLVVDDESGLRELYVAWLGEDYEVLEAADGTEALDVVDESVDVVLLDRRMPELSGDDTLLELRDRGLDPWVVMVSAVEPAPDIAELPFDDYLTKPAAGSDLGTVVETVLARASHQGVPREYFRVVAKQGLLEATHEEYELERSDAYADLRARREALEADLDVADVDLDAVVISPPES